jgi:REP element-mobilizing transposase RayT
MSYYRRKLPHWRPEGCALFITWRLHGSFSTSGWTQPNAGHAFRDLDTVLHKAVHGPTGLKDPRMASLVVSTLRQGETEKNWYRMAAFVVMPNHVHVLMEPVTQACRITQWIKGTTARYANQLLGRGGGPFWQHESFDHWVRNRGEHQRITRYIELNPVAARLAGRVEEWPWSSAYCAERAS